MCWKLNALEHLLAGDSLTGEIDVWMLPRSAGVGGSGSVKKKKKKEND